MYIYIYIYIWGMPRRCAVVSGTGEFTAYSLPSTCTMLSRSVTSLLLLLLSLLVVEVVVVVVVLLLLLSLSLLLVFIMYHAVKIGHRGVVLTARAILLLVVIILAILLIVAIIAILSIIVIIAILLIVAIIAILNNSDNLRRSYRDFGFCFLSPSCALFQ